MKLDAAVLFLPFGRHAAGDRMPVAHAHGLEARGVDAVLG
jgi:hypothetical protein